MTYWRKKLLNIWPWARETRFVCCLQKQFHTNPYKRFTNSFMTSGDHQDTEIHRTARQAKWNGKITQRDIFLRDSASTSIWVNLRYLAVVLYREFADTQSHVRALPVWEHWALRRGNCFCSRVRDISRHSVVICNDQTRLYCSACSLKPPSCPLLNTV